MRLTGIIKIMDRIGRWAAVAYESELLRHLPCETEENHRKPLSE
jgi:hypothetical protein